MTRPTAPPRSAPAALVPGIVVALLLVAAGVVGIRDLAVSQGWADGQPWVATLLERLDGLTPGIGVLLLGILAALLGLGLLVLALTPGRPTHVRATRGGDLWLTPAAVASLAAGAADRAAGVVSARATRASRRSAAVHVVTRGTDGTDARTAAQQAVGDLTPMKISVQHKELSS